MKIGNDILGPLRAARHDDEISRVYREHFEKGGWIPVIDWKLSGVPARSMAVWQKSLLLSGILATGQVWTGKDGSAGGLTLTGVFRYALKLLSGILNENDPETALIVGTKLVCMTGNGILRENGATGITYVVGKNGCKPLRIESGENPFSAIWREVSEVCGEENCRKIHDEAASYALAPDESYLDCEIPVDLLRKWMGTDKKPKERQAEEICMEAVRQEGLALTCVKDEPDDDPFANDDPFGGYNPDKPPF